MAKRDTGKYSYQRRVWAEETARRRGYDPNSSAWDGIFWALLISADGPDADPQADTSAEAAFDPDSQSDYGGDGGGYDDYGSSGGSDYGSSSSSSSYDGGGSYDSGGGGGDSGDGGGGGE